MKNYDIIKKIIEDFFEKTTFNLALDIVLKEDETIFINIQAENPQILIGEGGQTINEIQLLLRAILRRKIKDLFYLELDINDYKKRKNEYLREMAFSIADEVALLKEEKELEPMPAHERRIIHLALAERKDVVAKSVGDGLRRRIVIQVASS